MEVLRDGVKNGLLDPWSLISLWNGEFVTGVTKRSSRLEKLNFPVETDSW